MEKIELEFLIVSWPVQNRF